jgi:hypothetical protein
LSLGAEARNLPAREAADAPPIEAPSDAVRGTDFAEDQDCNHNHHWSL